MSVTDVFVSEVLENSKKLAKMEGRQEAQAEIASMISEGFKMLLPAITQLISADLAKPVDQTEHIESVRREFQAKLDTFESTLTQIRDLIK